MYANRQYTSRVSDRAGRYAQGPFPAEEFPGAGALDDLTRAEASEMPLILARYTALRAWLLLEEDGGGPVAEHALRSAREHLTAHHGGRAERELLNAALAAGHGARGRTLLERAGRAAAARGHGHGARALREAAYRSRWWNGGLPPPSRS